VSKSHVPVAEDSDAQGAFLGDRLANEAAVRIAAGFAAYADEFASITKRSKWRFQTRDWKGRHEDALERLDLYEKVLREAATAVAGLLGDRVRNKALWATAKEQVNAGELVDITPYDRAMKFRRS
jgi:isocitrate dehydrogenase kinase/phosphatase